MIIPPDRAQTDASQSSVCAPQVLIGTITPEILVRLQEHYNALSADDQAFVDAGPSETRRALRISQLRLAQMGAALCGLNDENLTLLSDDKGCPRFNAPLIPPLYLSISHSDTALAVAVSPFPIGIDIEDVRHMPKKPITLLFSSEEQESIIDDESFTRAWVRKEAYAKWLGTGLIDELASGVYNTETYVTDILIGTHAQYLGLAGTNCGSAVITEVEL